MNHSMLLDLRPLSIGELLDRTFRLYRNNFFTFLGIVALTQLPAYLIALSTDPLLEYGSSQRITGFLTIITFLLTIGFTQLGAAALTKAISDSYLGKTISIKATFQRLGSRTWLTLIFALIVAGLVLVGVAIPFIIVSFIPCIGRIVAVVGIIAIVLIGNVIISLVTPVVVLEKVRAGKATRRAWELAQKRFKWILGYLFLLGLLSFLITEGPTRLVVYLFDTIIGNVDFWIRNIVEQSVSLVLSSLFLPIQLTAITLMYFDLRIRFEGFDIMILAAATENSYTEASDLTTKTSL